MGKLINHHINKSFEYSLIIPLIIKPIKLCKNKTINTAYRLMFKGYNLEYIALQTGWEKRTITKWLQIDWNKAEIKPEYLAEEIWASVCFLIEDLYTIKEIENRLNLYYGNILTPKLIKSIKYYYKKFTSKPKQHLDNQLSFSFYN